ncbi:MBOAT family O-acyltransferase [Pseudogemmobacter sonorensis]|uniref:MBOAT family O-acyltransferase n=1 Tax=Pseudogemmobacter sonorensis TaxID=2989681 RepID=UPI00369D6244
MVFPTLEFVLFFAVVLALNLACDGRSGWRKGMLIAASYLFYAAWDPRFCLLMAGVSALAWGAGLLVNRPGLRGPVLAVSVTLLLGVLAVFKYANFFMLSLAQLLEALGLGRDMAWAGIILPVGISFYIFQAISYVVDVSRREVEPRRNPADVALYISFFPQLVAGPIVRASDFMPQIDAPAPPGPALRAEAVVLILTGLFKKMVVANYLAVLLVDPVFSWPQGQAAGMAWAALLGYAVQIYCDFSGYSDMAIGMALLLGYRFRPNFDQPYRARSLQEFWRRWHISLSSFIRDYLYIPLGGNRGGMTRTSLVLLGTMTLAGLWHGAAWPFVLWGALHGLGLVVERAARRAGLGLPGPLAMLATFAVVVLLWLPFRAADSATMLATTRALFRPGLAGLETLPAAVFVLIGIGLALNLAPMAARDGAIAALARLPAALQAGLLGLGVFLTFAFAQEGTAPFIYFQF